MQTLTERLADKTKTTLYEGFTKAVYTIADNENITADDVYQKWLIYVEKCRNSDQSPVMSEFCQWNKFREVQVI